MMNSSIPIMFGINYLISYFVMSNIMVYSSDHIYHNLNKVYMGVFMASLMGLAELWVMGRSMMDNTSFLTYNIIFAVLALLTGCAIRKQTLISDNQFLRSMIEHHSSALLMAEKILPKTQNKEIFQLANGLLNSQSHEINQMSHLLQMASS